MQPWEPNSDILYGFWVLQVLRITNRMFAYNWAMASWWHGWSSMLLTSTIQLQTPELNKKKEMEKSQEVSDGEKQSSQSDTRPEESTKLAPQSNSVKRTYSSPSKNDMPQETSNVEHEHGNLLHTQEAKRPLEQTNPHRIELSSIRGYHYFVRGETKQKTKVRVPDYLIYLDVLAGNKFITLDKIWECNNWLIGKSIDPDRKLKYLSLSFVLYRLLRCRLDDLPIPEGRVSQTRKLIFREILGNTENDERGFQIIEAELAFINDYCYTRNPFIFWGGFPVIDAGFFVLTVAALIWLVLDIRRLYEPSKAQYIHYLHQVNVDLIITWVFMFFVLVKEFWEMGTYVFSDWSKVLWVCKSVENPCCIKNKLMEKLIRFICRHRMLKQWHGTINIYNFIESFNYDPSNWNMLYWATLGMAPKRSEGEKPSPSIKVPKEVRKAVIQSLRLLKFENKHESACTSKIITNRLLDTMSMLLPDKVLGENFRFLWSDQLVTASHFILVWHIATCLCEIKYSQDHNIKEPNNSMLHTFLSLFNCCSSEPFVMRLEKLPENIKPHYSVASSISQYCTYLLIIEPELLPDHFFVPKLVFEKTVSDTREALRNCKSLKEMYECLMNKARKGKAAPAESLTILQMGTDLGYHLVQMEELDRWKALAELWANLLVYMAPTWNVAAHKKCLATGGEFITQIWAILSHLGILERTLLPQKKVTGENVV